jgi:hypothetical protein
LLFIDADAACTAAEAERGLVNLHGASAITVAVSVRPAMHHLLADAVDVAITQGPPDSVARQVQVADPYAAVAQLQASVAVSPVAAVSLA